MSPSVSFRHCAPDRDPLPLLPTTSQLAIPLREVPDAIPFADQIPGLLGKAPPGESLLALGALVAWFAWRSIARARPRSGAAPNRGSRSSLGRYASIAAPKMARSWQPVMLRTAVAALAAVAFAPMIFWLALTAADFQRERHEHLAAFGVLQVTAEVFPLVSWIGRWQEANPVNALTEANAVEGIREALQRGKTSVALELAGWSNGVSPELRIARSAAYLVAASSALRGDRLGEALGFAELAVAADPEAREPGAAVSISLTHLTVRRVVQGDLASARRHFERIDRDWRPPLFAVLGGLVAREEATRHLTAKPPRLRRAAETLEHALQTAVSLGQYPPILACDFAGAQEMLAFSELKAGRGAAAVAALRKAEKAVEGSPLTRELFPQALRAKGLREITERHGVAATESLEEARSRSAGDWPELTDDLVTAWLLRGRGELDQGQLDPALNSLLWADFYSRGSAITADAVAGARLARANHALQRGDWNRAREELAGARRRSRFRGEARMRLAYLDDAWSRVLRIAKVARWASLPIVRGEMPQDSNGDGSADLLVYYDDNAAPTGWMDLRNRRQVAFTLPPNEKVASIVIRDRGLGADFDEWIRFEGEGNSTSILDVNGDARPDLRLTYHDFELIREEPLSGRVLVHVKSGVIRDDQDPLLGGLTDPYIWFSLDGRPVWRTATQQGTQFPTWSEALVIDYRFGDRVRLDLFDEDLVFDDWMDWFVFDSLPTSGFVLMEQGKAALDIDVFPSRLEEGHVVVFDQPQANVFRDMPPTGIPEIDELVQTAQQAEVDAEVMAIVGRIAASEILIMALLPEAPLVLQIGAGVALDSALQPLFE